MAQTKIFHWSILKFQMWFVNRFFLCITTITPTEFHISFTLHISTIPLPILLPVTSYITTQNILVFTKQLVLPDHPFTGHYSEPLGFGQGGNIGGVTLNIESK